METTEEVKKTRKKIGLLPKVLIAIALGIGCSFFFPTWAVRIFLTINSIFSNFLGMFIPLLIIGLVAAGIADLGKGAGKLLAITAGLAYLSTILAGFFSYFTCTLTFPTLLSNQADAFRNMLTTNSESSVSLEPFFTIEMPAFIDVTAALITAFILGLGVTSAKGNSLKGVLDDFRDVVTTVISKAIVPILPLFIFGIFLGMGSEDKVGPILGMFAKIIIVIFAMHITVLVMQFLIAGAISKKRPFKSLITMLPAYLTALGTSSSAATIPVTLAQAKKNGIDEGIADFVIPLCATVHLPCSILKIVACSFAISFCMGMPVDIATFSGFIMMCGITMVAAPGVPGGAIMAALGLLESMLGFTPEMQGIIIALYITMDSFGTAGNVTGDGAIAMIIDKINRRE